MSCLPHLSCCSIFQTPLAIWNCTSLEEIALVGAPESVHSHYIGVSLNAARALSDRAADIKIAEISVWDEASF